MNDTLWSIFVNILTHHFGFGLLIYCEITVCVISRLLQLCIKDIKSIPISKDTQLVYKDKGEMLKGMLPASVCFAFPN